MITSRKQLFIFVSINGETNIVAAADEIYCG